MNGAQRHDLQLAYVLHSRAYCETSLILEMLTLEQGRVAIVARGAKRGKAKNSAILQPFSPLHISWYGSGELVTLTHVEPAAPAAVLAVKRMICGLYINELLIKLLPKWDPCAQLFAAYQQVLQELAAPHLPEQPALRKFEKHLLKSIGYGLQLTLDIDSGLTIEPQQYYLFEPQLGPRLASKQQLDAIPGSSLLAFAMDDYASTEVLLDLKRVMRIVLAYHLGVRSIIARQLL